MGYDTDGSLKHFLSIREEPMEKEFDIMYKTYSHPKNICQSSKLLIGSNGVELGNNIVILPRKCKIKY